MVVVNRINTFEAPCAYHIDILIGAMLFGHRPEEYGERLLHLCLPLKIDIVVYTARLDAIDWFK